MVRDKAASDVSRNLSTAKHPPVGVAEARAAMLAMIAPLPIETIAAGEAHGRVLAEPVSARRDQPPFAASPMICATELSKTPRRARRRRARYYGD